MSVSPCSRTATESVKNDGQTLSQAPAALKLLSAVAVCGKVESLEDVDELLRDIQDLDKKCEGVPRLLLHGTTLVVRDEFFNLRRLANDRPLPSEKLSKAERKARRKDLKVDGKNRRAEIIQRAFANWRSCELVARVLQMDCQERTRLDLYAATRLGMPRVQAGEPCKQVLKDLGIGEEGQPKNYYRRLL